MKLVHDPARVRVVKLMSGVGTSQLWSSGQPVSVEELQHKEILAGLICAGVTTAVQGLGVDRITVARWQPFDRITPIELHGAWVGTAPAANGSGDCGAACCVDRDNVSSEEAVTPGGDRDSESALAGKMRPLMEPT